MQNNGLLIVKNHLSLQFVENVWFQHLVLRLCFQVEFTFNKYSFQEILWNLVEKMKHEYILLKLTYCISTRSFDLWRSKGGHDIFTFVISFSRSNQYPEQMIIGLFEAIKNIGQTLANNLIKLFDQ